MNCLVISVSISTRNPTYKMWLESILLQVNREVFNEIKGIDSSCESVLRLVDENVYYGFRKCMENYYDNNFK